MAKIIKLNGIRKKVILCRIKNIGEYQYTVMRAITEAQEKEIDDNEQIEIDGNVFTKDSIYCYGQFDINNPEDLHYVSKFNIINLDDENPVHSGFDFDKGEVVIEGNVAKTYACYDAIKWFKYNYLLLGKPKRIIIYKCKKCEL